LAATGGFEGAALAAIRVACLPAGRQAASYPGAQVKHALIRSAGGSALNA